MAPLTTISYTVIIIIIIINIFPLRGGFLLCRFLSEGRQGLGPAFLFSCDRVRGRASGSAHHVRRTSGGRILLPVELPYDHGPEHPLDGVFPHSFPRARQDQ